MRVLFEQQNSKSIPLQKNDFYVYKNNRKIRLTKKKKTTQEIKKFSPKKIIYIYIKSNKTI